MKHFKHLLFLMLIALGMCPTLAQTQQHEAPFRAEGDPPAALTVLSATLTTTQPEVTPDGKYAITISVRLRNTGEVDLNPGDPGFELEVYSDSKEELLRTFPVEEPIAAGAYSQYFDLELEMDYRQYPDAEKFYIRENVSGGEYNVQYTCYPVPYEPVFGVDNGGKTLSSGDVVNFGMVQGKKDIVLTAYNDGTAPVTITGMEATNGFTVEGITAGTVMEPKSEQEFTVSTPATGSGEVASRLTISYGDGKRMTLNLKAVMMDDTKWFEDFQEGQIPVNMVITTTGTYSYWGVYNDSNNPDNKVLRTSSYGEDMISSPLLDMAEGESISFDAARYSYNAKLNIYWSTDRKNWTLVQTIGTQTDLDPEWQLPSTNSEWATYTVTGFPAGQIYIGFGASYIVLDNIYGGTLVQIDHDMQYVNSSLPGKGTVNHELSATATFKNVNTKTELAGAYAVRLYMDGEAVAEAETVDLGPNTQQTFQFTFTPHKAGEMQAYVAFEVDDYVLKTSETTLTVDEEVVSTDVVVGSPTTTTQNAPVWVNYEYSESEIIYTAEQLGIKPGSMITEIVYRGYSTANGSVTSHVKAWIENTDVSQIAYSDGIKSTSDMTQIFDADVTFNRAGGYSDHVELIDIKLAEPFVYEGGNLRLSFHAESDSYKQVYFEAQSLSGQCIYRGVSNQSQLSAKNPSNCFYLPVAYISVAKEPTVLSGTVTLAADGSAVAGQRVTLSSGNVAYEATTNADGQYSMTVVQDELTYQMRIERDGYNPFIKEVKFTEGSMTVDAQLEVSKGLVVEAISVPGDAVANNETTVTVKVTNYSSKDVPANYTARLFNADGEQLAEAEAVVIKAGEQHDFSFTFRVLGTDAVEVYAVFESATFTAESDHATFTPKAESVGDVVTTGEVTGVNYSLPLDFYYTYSASQVVYSADRLGLAEGAMIDRIAFTGYNQDKQISADVTVYLENTTDEEGYVNDAGRMTKVFEGPVVVKTVGSSSNHVVLLDLQLDKLFKYEGSNLRLWIEHHADADQKNGNINFSVDSSADSYMYDEDEEGTPVWTLKYQQPVMIVSTLDGAIMAGTVTDASGAGVAGADVKLSSDGAVYVTRTDDEGFYRLEVAQPEHTFTLTVSADGYLAETETKVSLRDASTTKDVVLTYAARTFAQGEVYTVCLPVGVDQTATAAAGRFYTLVGIVDDVLQFDEVASLEAYVPYLMVAGAAADAIFADAATWTVDASQSCTTTVDNVQFVGTMSRRHVEAQNGMACYGYRAADGVFGQFQRAYVGPFRAYLTVSGGQSAGSRLVKFNDLTPTGISITGNSSAAAKSVYDLQGRPVSVSQMKRGSIYVVNGKKMVY